MERALVYARDHQEEALHDLQRLVRQPGISTQGIGMSESAALTRDLMASAGLSAEPYPVPGGYPVVVGHGRGGGKTLLFYNHYDVQPPEPLGEWNHEPFGGEVSEGRIWGRGSNDMKGALVGRLWAIRSWLEGEGSLPLGVKFVAEGEEEIGSPHLEEFVRSNTDLLRADACVWESGGLIDGQAEIVCGCKGVLVAELTCREGETDLHSASAAVFDSAAWRLVRALSTLYDDETGQCTMDGYLDTVRPPSPEDLALCERLGTPEKLERDLEASGRGRYHASLRGGTETVAAYAFRPTCNLQGIVSGYTGEGMKNVLPRVAKAKLDFRLVADQDSGVALEQLRQHLGRRGYVDIEVAALARVEPSRSGVDDPLVRAMARAARETYGQDPLASPSMGGFGPMHTITKHLGIATIMGGDYRRPGGCIHAPDEHLWLEDFYAGIEATIRLIRAYAEEPV